MGTIIAVCTSENKGEQKSAQPMGVLTERGLEGDAHAGDWHRQVSLLSETSVNVMRAKGLELLPGAFGENFVVRGIEVKDLPIGVRLQTGEGVILEITQIGKECHDRCAIYYQAGDCIMPREGVFARVINGGPIRPGDSIKVMEADLEDD